MRFLFLWLVILAYSFSATAQKAKITQLLQTALTKEINNKTEKDTIQYLDLFSIKNDSLFLAYRYNDKVNSTYYINESKVALADIFRFDKDINVLFICRENAVTISTSQYNLYTQQLITSEAVQSNMFFTGMYAKMQDERFRNKVLKAFEKANFSIVSEFWYD